MPAKRQLAAILFADVVGYTTLMEENEQHALKILGHFRHHLQSITPIYDGEIIQFYGDGCLIIFPSAVRAVRCAIVMQEALRQSPHVPVRMACHQGDILRQGDNIFGNSVNITARIESMGVPGCVLLSEEVSTELKNQGDIQVLLLGDFQFKNIAKPMEIYAVIQNGLQWPKKSQMQGKFAKHNQVRSIAVLPFENRSSDPEQLYFSDGISEEIIYGLSQLANLKVAGRKSSFSFRNSDKTTSEIAHVLKVESILEGSVRKAGNRVRINVQLINANDGFLTWSERFDRELDDVFLIQEEIAEKVVAKLKVGLMQLEKGRTIVPTKTHDVHAYELYLQGKNYLDQRTNIKAALNCFKKAVDSDPHFAAAYIGQAYAFIYRIIFDNLSPLVGFPSAQKAVLEAMHLVTANAESHTIQAWLDFYYRYDFEGCKENFKKALLIDSTQADTYRIKAYLYAMMHEAKEAIRCAVYAHKLDPLSFNAWLSLGDVYYRCGYYEEAASEFAEMMKVYPNHQIVQLLNASIHYVRGDTEKARSIFELHTSLPHSLDLFSVERFVFAVKDGHPELAIDLLTHFEHKKGEQWVSPMMVAVLHYFLGNEEEMTVNFERAILDRDPGILQINGSGMLASFRDHVLVQNFYRKIGLPAHRDA